MRTGPDHFSFSTSHPWRSGDHPRTPDRISTVQYMSPLQKAMALRHDGDRQGRGGSPHHLGSCATPTCTSSTVRYGAVHIQYLTHARGKTARRQDATRSAGPFGRSPLPKGTFSASKRIPIPGSLGPNAMQRCSHAAMQIYLMRVHGSHVLACFSIILSPVLLVHIPRMMAS
jgi:hypothetical protein